MAKKIKKFILLSSIAAAAGYVTGVLTSPKSGQKMRKDIKKQTNDKIVKAEERIVVIEAELNELIQNLKDSANDKDLSAKIDKTLSAANKTKSKLISVHDSIKDGSLTSDSDIEKAIKEVEKAAEHIKHFLLK